MATPRSVRVRAASAPAGGGTASPSRGGGVSTSGRGRATTVPAGGGTASPSRAASGARTNAASTRSGGGSGD